LLSGTSRVGPAWSWRADRRRRRRTTYPASAFLVYQISAQVGRGFAARFDFPDAPQLTTLGEDIAEGQAGSGTSNFPANTVTAQRYDGVSGQVLSASAYLGSSATGNMRIGLYADNAGEPGALIATTEAVNEDSPYDVGMFIPGTHGNGALMAQVGLTRAVSFADDFAGARAYAGVSATAETVLDVHWNGSFIGASFAAQQTTYRLVRMLSDRSETTGCIDGHLRLLPLRRRWRDSRC
jgi:hypothetical protein